MLHPSQSFPPVHYFCLPFLLPSFLSFCLKLHRSLYPPFPSSLQTSLRLSFARGRPISSPSIWATERKPNLSRSFAGSNGDDVALSGPPDTMARLAPSTWHIEALVLDPPLFDDPLGILRFCLFFFLLCRCPCPCSLFLVLCPYFPVAPACPSTAASLSSQHNGTFPSLALCLSLQPRTLDLPILLKRLPF